MTKKSNRKLRAQVARNRGDYANTSHSMMYEAMPNVSVLDGLLLSNSRTYRNKVRNRRDTNANRKNGGSSTYYRQKEGWAGNNIPATSSTYQPRPTRNGR